MLTHENNIRWMINHIEKLNAQMEHIQFVSFDYMKTTKEHFCKVKDENGKTVIYRMVEFTGYVKLWPV